MGFPEVFAATLILVALIIYTQAKKFRRIPPVQAPDPEPTDEELIAASLPILDGFGRIDQINERALEGVESHHPINRVAEFRARIEAEAKEQEKERARG